MKIEDDSIKSYVAAIRACSMCAYLALKAMTIIYHSN